MPITRAARFLLLATLALLLGARIGLPALASGEPAPRYPENLAWRLVTEREIQEFTGCPQGLGDEERQAPPLFETPSRPLGDVVPAEGDRQVLVPARTQWEVAPFPDLDPPPPSGLSPEARRKWEEERRRTAGPTAPESAFGEVPTRLQEPPSALLRPRPTWSGEALVAPDDALPVPFSLRRYRTKDRGFFQIALYGGTTGFAAERAYRTLRAAAPNREPVPGLGDEAFLALVERAPEPVPSPSPAPVAAAGPAFGEIEVLGPKRLDLVDPGLVKARTAPSFQSIPADLGLPAEMAQLRKQREAAREAGEDPLDKGGTDPFGGRATAGRGGVQVLVAFLPLRAVVLEIAMDDRIGDTQSLVRLAMMVQARLLTRW